MAWVSTNRSGGETPVELLAHNRQYGRVLLGSVNTHLLIRVCQLVGGLAGIVGFGSDVANLARRVRFLSRMGRTIKMLGTHQVSSDRPCPTRRFRSREHHRQPTMPYDWTTPDVGRCHRIWRLSRRGGVLMRQGLYRWRPGLLEQAPTRISSVLESPEPIRPPSCGVDLWNRIDCSRVGRRWMALGVAGVPGNTTQGRANRYIAMRRVLLGGMDGHLLVGASCRATTIGARGDPSGPVFAAYAAS